MSFIPGSLVAAGRVNGADGLVTGAGFFARGVAVARTGAGVYTLTLPADHQLDSNCCVVVAAPEANDTTYKVDHTSDQVKTLTFRTGAANTDTTFGFAIYRGAGQGGSTGL